MVAVDGFIFPHGASAGGRERGGVGLGADGEEHEAFAVAPVYPDFQGVGFGLGPDDDRMPGAVLDA